MELCQVNKICRCCLKTNGQMKPLYGFSLDEMLRSLVGIEVEPNDGLPELICFQCVLQLSRAFRFKMQCKKSNVTILELIKTTLTDGDGTHFESFFDENEYEVSNNEDNKSLETTSQKHKQNESSAIENLPLDRTTPGAEVKIIEDECTTCKKVFNSRKQLLRHVKIHDSKKNHTCLDCNKMFSQSCNLKKHMLKHNGGLNTALLSQHLCSICGKRFKYASSLSKHNKLHTGKNLLYCSSCPKFFLENTTLKNHIQSHTGDRSFVCCHCKKSYTNSSNLNKHLRSHSNKRPFECNICGRTFVEQNYLTIHIKTHDKKQNVLCSKCGKCLANAKSLHAHMRLHSNKRLFRCGFENCEKRFSRTDTVAIHRRIHTGEKPYSCDKCSNSFKTQNQLLNHSRTHIISEKHVGCSQSSSVSSAKENLNYHSDENYKGLPQEEETKQTLGQSLLLFELNENGECSFVCNS